MKSSSCWYFWFELCWFFFSIFLKWKMTPCSLWHVLHSFPGCYNTMFFFTKERWFFFLDSFTYGNNHLWNGSSNHGNMMLFLYNETFTFYYPWLWLVHDFFFLLLSWLFIQKHIVSISLVYAATRWFYGNNNGD